MAKEGEKVMDSSIEKRIQWKVWTERFDALISIGALFLVKSFLDRKVCICCGKKADPQSWKLGGLGEPYCSEECYSAAGRAMFTFEFRQGNI